MSQRVAILRQVINIKINLFLASDIYSFLKGFERAYEYLCQTLHSIQQHTYFDVLCARIRRLKYSQWNENWKDFECEFVWFFVLLFARRIYMYIYQRSIFFFWMKNVSMDCCGLLIFIRPIWIEYWICEIKHENLMWKTDNGLTT